MSLLRSLSAIGALSLALCLASWSSATARARALAPPPKSEKPPIAVANYNGDPSNDGTIETFRFDANGNVKPRISISGSNTGIINPQVLAIDGTGDLVTLYFQQPFQPTPSISVFAAGQNGNVAPARVIVDAATSHQVRFVGIDDAGYIYAEYLEASGKSEGIDVFAPGANGVTTPVRNISGSKTLMNQPLTIVQMYVGRAGDIWWRCDGEVGPPLVVGYPPGSNGNVAPVRELNPPPAGTSSFAVDDRARLYLTVGTDLDVYKPSGRRPYRTYQPDCTLSCGVAAVYGRFALFVDAPFPNPDAIVTYDLSVPSGPLRAVRTIAGGRTGIATPLAVAVR
jgi:hypothetical protein